MKNYFFMRIMLLIAFTSVLDMQAAHLSQRSPLDIQKLTEHMRQEADTQTELAENFSESSSTLLHTLKLLIAVAQKQKTTHDQQHKLIEHIKQFVKDSSCLLDSFVLFENAQVTEITTQWHQANNIVLEIIKAQTLSIKNLNDLEQAIRDYQGYYNVIINILDSSPSSQIEETDNAGSSDKRAKQPISFLASNGDITFNPDYVEDKKDALTFRTGLGGAQMRTNYLHLLDNGGQPTASTQQMLESAGFNAYHAASLTGEEQVAREQAEINGEPLEEGEIREGEGQSGEGGEQPEEIDGRLLVVPTEEIPQANQHEQREEEQKLPKPRGKDSDDDESVNEEFNEEIDSGEEELDLDKERPEEKEQEKDEEKKQVQAQQASKPITQDRWYLGKYVSKGWNKIRNYCKKEASD